MPSNKAESILNSLRSRVWLAVCGLALANCVAGVGAYLVGTLVLSSPLIPLLIAFSLSAVVTLAYGRWLADEVVRPVKKVNLAAKSIERNPTTPLPSTTGSSETDEILFSLQRNNRQFVNLIKLMDRVSAGDTEAAVLPLDSPDKLSSSFQKLVAKVTESIDALNTLEAMRAELAAITTELERVESSRSIPDFSANSPQTAALSDALNRCMANLAGEMRQLRTEIHNASPTADDAAAALKSTRETAERSVESLRKTIAAVKTGAGSVTDHPGTDPGIGHVEARSATKFGAAAQQIREAASRAGQPRRHAGELQRLMRKLRERSSALAGILRSVEDITRRTKLIALNTSLTGDARGDLAPFTDEFKVLSERGERIKKEIVDLERSIVSEIADCESAVRELTADGAELHILTGNSAAILTEIEPAIAYLTEIPEKMAAITETSRRDREDVMRSVSSGYFELENCLPSLRAAEQKVNTLRDSIKNATATGASDDEPVLETYEAGSPVSPTGSIETVLEQ